MLLALVAGAGLAGGPAGDAVAAPLGSSAKADTAGSAPGPVAADSASAPAASGPTYVLEGYGLAGDPLLDEARLAEILPFAPGDTLRAEDSGRAAAVLAERVRRSGWWSASVTGEFVRGRRDTTRHVLHLDLDAGEPVRIGEIGLRGNQILSQEEIRAQLEIRSGDPFDPAALERDLQRLLRRYSESGYPLARVYPSRFRRGEEGRLDFDLRIGEGPPATIESVRIFGNDVTQPRVVARIGGVRAGDRFNLRRIEAMPGRLRREGLFTRVSDPRLVKGSRDASIGVEITVEEAPANLLFGVLGYNRNDDGEGEVVGLVDVDLRNILGSARRAAFHFERQASNVRDLEFRFREPWVLGTPLSLEFGAGQAIRDTLYTRTDLELRLELPLGDRSRVDLAGERRESTFDVRPDSSATETATGGSVGLTADWRDGRINPSRGFWSEGRVGVRVTEADVQRTRLQLEAHVYLPLVGRWLFSEQAGFAGVWSDDEFVPEYDQFYLGGTNTVRGYNEEQFRGEQVWWSRHELRWRTSTRSRIYGFGDVGRYRFRGGTPGEPRPVVRDTVVGWGFGMALESRTGVLRFELALGEGDTFSDAKVHVGLEQEF